LYSNVLKYLLDWIFVYSWKLINIKWRSVLIVKKHAVIELHIIQTIIKFRDTETSKFELKFNVIDLIT